MTAFDQELYKALKNGDYVDAGKLDFCLKTAKEQNTSLSDVLLRNSAIADNTLGKVVAEMTQMPFVSLSKTQIPSPILHIVPQVVAMQQQAIAFEESDSKIKVATAVPDNELFFTFLAQKTGKTITVCYATPNDIADALHKYNQDLKERVSDMLPSQEAKDKPKKLLAKMPIPQLVDTIIAYAFKNNAVSVHIEPDTDEIRVRFRIDGVLHDQVVLPKDLHGPIVERIKSLAKVPADSQQAEGSFKVQLHGDIATVRVSMMPMVAGESVVFHIVTSAAKKLTLFDLDLSDTDLKKVEAAITKPFGLIIATGPQDSGKTTLMYSILKKLNTKDRSIVTVEQAIPYGLDGVNQLQADPQSLVDNGQKVLRQDPNIVYVSDMEDPGTAGVCITTALTGHLVLSTLHASDTASAIERLLAMDIEPFKIGSTMTIVIGQRLVRTICKTCQTSETIKVDTLPDAFPQAMIKHYFGDRKDIIVAKGKGCARCHKTGYLGRTGIFEVLVVTEAIRDLITKKATPKTIEKKAIAEGMTPMMEDGIAKVHRNETTFEELLRVLEM